MRHDLHPPLADVRFLVERALVEDLTPFGDRDTTAPEYVERLEAAVADIEGARITVGPIENGPPVEEFPFAAQITATDDNVDETELRALIEQMAEEMNLDPDHDI